MLALKKLQNIQQKNKSLICLGLDLDVKRMSPEFTGSTKAMFDFAQQIIQATKDKVCAYKPNLAFYENLGPEGLSLLKLIVQRIPEDIPVILDGKRGDISNTAAHYANNLFGRLNADWVTINPYLGYDSMRPFIEYKERGVFVLCLTSNAGARDFQELKVDGKPLYQMVAEKVAYWNKDNNCGLVVGATHPEQLADIRHMAKDMPLLIPGVGAQGGALERAVTDGTGNFRKPAVINVSRSVLYASTGKDFAERSRAELEKLNAIVESCRPEKKSKEEDQQAENYPSDQRHNNRTNNHSSSKPSEHHG
jgi:orotidine-5'-phosphate decarboxylase